MKPCIHCQQIPMWHLARNLSDRDKSLFYSFTGCHHANTFSLSKGFVPMRQCAEVSREWDDLQETAFADMTATWTEVERTRHRVKLFGVPKPELQQKPSA